MRDAIAKAHEDKRVDFGDADAEASFGADGMRGGCDISPQVMLEAENMVLGCVRALSRETDVPSATSALLRTLGTYLDADRASIVACGTGDVAQVYAWCASQQSSQHSAPTHHVCQGALAQTPDQWAALFDKGTCVAVDDAGALPEAWRDVRDALVRNGTKSLMVVPIEQEGRIAGYIRIDNPAISKMHASTVPLIALGCYYGATVQRIAHANKLVAESSCDGLTGLFNRARYKEDVELVQREGKSLGVVFLDVNDLKVTNDRYGHDRGDAILRSCAATMRAALPCARLYRIGGDEFVALVQGVDEASFSAMVANLERSCAHADEDGEKYAAIGSQWSKDATDAPTMILAADAEMYKKKRRFRLEKMFADRIFDEGVLPPMSLAHEGDVRKGEPAREKGRELGREREQEREPELGQEREPGQRQELGRERDASVRMCALLLNGMRVGISKHVLNDEFELIWANDWFYEIMECSRKEYAELFGGSLDECLARDSEGHVRFASTFAQALETNRSRYECVVSQPRKSGERAWIRIVGVFSQEKSEGYPIVYNTFTDVTDAVEAGQCGCAASA